MFRKRTGFGGDMATWPIAALRIYAGVFFLIHGWSKLQHGSEYGNNLVRFFKSNDDTFGFYQSVLDSIIIPNKVIFGWLVAGGEFFLGIALILGLMTRYAAVAGAFMVMNFWFVKGQGFFEGRNHDVVWIIILLVLALIPAGRVMGLDARLSDRLPWLR